MKTTLSRRDFLRKTGILTGAMLLPPFMLYNSSAHGAISTKKEGDISFGIISDVHFDLVPDAAERLERFLSAALAAKTDFIIDLGDFVNAFQGSSGPAFDFVHKWRQCPIPHYNVLGNHDMDKCTKSDFMNCVGMQAPYYSFECGDFHFVVLDPNYLHRNGKFEPYSHSNFYIDSSMRAWINPEQMEWLKGDIERSEKPVIIFSHQSLERVVSNRAEVRAILEQENKRVGWQKVVAAFSGHDHTDYHLCIEGIHYIQINSASYHYIMSPGDYSAKIAQSRGLSAQDLRRYPVLKHSLVYRDALFGIVHVSCDEVRRLRIRMQGTSSMFLPPAPSELGLQQSSYPLPLSSKVSDFLITS